MTTGIQALAAQFSEADSQCAFDEWGANCGPGALAGICRMSLDDVRPHLGNFEARGYMNPTLMYAALNGLGVVWRKRRPGEGLWPAYGLVRVVWEGPWTKPGVPARAWYRHTHWIGTAVVDGQRGIFDINTVNNGTAWVALDDWIRIIPPWLTAGIKGATGEWRIVNGIEVVL